MNLQNLVPIPELYVSHESAQKLKLDAAGSGQLGSDPPSDM